MRQKEIQRFEKKSRQGIDYERLSEFFFDLCLSWCQHLDIETFLFFVNGVFLNITEGQHINISQLKDLENVNVLSIEFFNHLLAYRSVCEQNRTQTYNQWYLHNFQRTKDMVQRIEANLQDAFKENPDENRILDIWIDLPTQVINQFIDSHFDKMNAQLLQIDRACRSTGRLVQSIQIMEQLKKLATVSGSVPATQKQYNATV